MAKIEDFVARVRDDRLRDAIAAEVREIKKTKLKRYKDVKDWKFKLTEVDAWVRSGKAGRNSDG